MKKAFILITLGAILEYYDFAIFIYFAKRIGESLIPVNDPVANLIASFGVLSIGALVRPLGGVLFAHFGDTVGRKRVFAYTILLMALPTFLIGLIPSYQVIGIWATVILVLLRCLQGFAIGGEIPGSIVFAYELASKKNKALSTNVVIAGTNVGFFAASMLGAFLITRTDLPFASWRIAFFLGGIFGIISYFLRKNLIETTEFTAYQQHLSRSQTPLVNLIKNHWYNLLQLTAFGGFLAASLAVFTFFMPTYLSTYFGFDDATLLRYNSYSIIIFIAAAFIAGKFDYWFGKKFMLLSFPLFIVATGYLFTHYPQMVIEEVGFYNCLALIFIGIICGRLPVLSASFFPVEVRYSGVGLTYNIAFGIVAGLTQVVLFSLLKWTDWLWLPALYVAVFGTFAFLAIATVPSRRLVDYT